MSQITERVVGALLSGLDRMDADIAALQAQLRGVMVTQQQFDDRMKALDEATNEIASDLKALRDQLAAGTIPDGVVDALDTRIAKLQALGKDPETTA